MTRTTISRHRKRKMLTANRLLIRWEQTVKTEVLRLLGSLANALAEGKPEAIDDFEQRLAKLLRDRLEQVAAVFGFETLDSAKLHHAHLEEKSIFDRFRARIKTWLSTHATRQSKYVADAIRKRVQRALQDTLTGSEREAVKAVASQLRKGLALSIAQRIARTETHTAANMGSQEMAEESDADMVKEWGATEDERTRESHAAADGQTRELDETFQVGSANLAFPGDPDGPPEEIINCRCVALYWPRTSSGKIVR